MRLVNVVKSKLKLAKEPLVYFGSWFVCAMLTMVAVYFMVGL